MAKPRPRARDQHVGSLLFPEGVPDQPDDRVQSFAFVGPVGFEQHAAPLARREHHHAHQALGVDFASAARQRYVALIFGCQQREFGGSGCIQPQLVKNLKLALLHVLSPVSVLELWCMLANPAGSLHLAKRRHNINL